MIFLDAFLFTLAQSLQNDSLYIGQRILTGFADIFGGLVLLVIGILIIVLLVAAAIVLLPAIIVAVLVWFLTGSFFYAGIAFLVVALISLVAMAD
jgi:hypothetical protein